MIANRLAPVAYVGSMKRFSIPIGVFVAQRYFGEKVSSGQWLAIIIITAGAIGLAFDPTPAKIIDLTSYWFYYKR